MGWVIPTPQAQPAPLLQHLWCDIGLSWCYPLLHPGQGFIPKGSAHHPGSGFSCWAPLQPLFNDYYCQKFPLLPLGEFSDTHLDTLSGAKADPRPPPLRTFLFPFWHISHFSVICSAIPNTPMHPQFPSVSRWFLSDVPERVQQQFPLGIAMLLILLRWAFHGLVLSPLNWADLCLNPAGHP